METALDVYSYAFQSCKSYNKIDGSVSRNDFGAICRHYQLPFDKIVEATGGGAQDSITQDAFFHYLKRHQHHLHHQHHQHQHQHQNSRGHLDYEHYDRPTSPSSRPHSGNKQGIYSSHHNRRSLRYPTSPTGGGGFDQDKFTPDEPTKRRQEHNRTPDNFLLSPETDPRPSRHNRGDRHRADLDRIAADYINPRPTVSRPAPSPPPPLPPHHPTLSRKMFPRGDRSEHRSTRGGDTDDDDEVNGETFYPHLPVASRRTCRNCKTLHRQVQELQDDLRVSRSERERLEQSNERLRKDYQMAQGNDLHYAQLCRENEKLRQEIKRLRRETSDPDSDRTYYDRQFEDLKKQKEDLEDEMLRDRVSLKAYKKECSALKAQYQSLRLKNEELQRANWRVVDENQKLMVRLMDEDKASIYSRQRGDGNSEEHSTRSSYASGEFQRLTPMRQTYHLPGKNEVTRDPSSRPRRGRVEMKRTSSAGQALDSDTPVRDQDTGRHDDYSYGYPRGKSVKSVPSETSETLGFAMVTTTPDDQSQVFMVLDEDVSRSVLPEGLSKESELAMIYALQNCHSIQELIKCLVSYGISASGDKLQGFQVENDHLKQCVDHLKSKNTTLAHSFDSAKSNTELMYYRAQIFEANNTRLVYALKLCAQAVEVFEVLVELRHFDSRSHGSNPSYFPSFPEFNSLESSTRSPDREPAPVKHSAVSRARNLLHTLDSNTELQNYLPGSRPRHGSSDYHQTAHWASTLSQNTSNTSGLSSMSGGMDGEITHGELERLRLYTQALVNYQERLVNTLVPIDGLRALDTVKKSEMIKDCLPPGEHGSHIVDLEDAANAEELGKVREEKAELRSQIYMMEQEKRRMELEVSRMLLHKQKCDRMLQDLQFIVREEKRKRKKERKGRKGDASMPPHDQSNMSELSIEYQAALEREKDLSRKYEELFGFLSHHVKNSQDTSEELMRFVKELRRANSALVDAFEKSKKRQQAEKKRMKQELVSYMNKVQGNSAPTNEEPTNGTIYA